MTSAGAVLTHTVNSAVDNATVLVDIGGSSADVHRGHPFEGTIDRPSSTPTRASRASVQGGCTSLSPVSTDATTMDVSLYSVNKNLKSNNLVRSGDEPSRSHTAAPTVVSGIGFDDVTVDGGTMKSRSGWRE